MQAHMILSIGNFLFLEFENRKIVSRFGVRVSGRIYSTSAAQLFFSREGIHPNANAKIYIQGIPTITLT